ncbi:hypothetical protein P5V35_23735 [Mycobacteroides abscessus subsp. massiliense]|uniref:hypothetical protein n=1 Tax=Mycobacteroides abscessus TaxID=36809 RepID=UPI0009D32746|nr:hypothetical protein [Mycobacteroides abscessus]MDO3208824.1 hypothetical protein [Mycobacteroides abscessus subsp. massiliense]SKT80623.1 Uncharacterised protein [Mycobacteroides abscessus subsp. massiliense]SKT99233.1 Uncharacterised protein [Mycobacteroides abscessus subsp. massiliense]
MERIHIDNNRQDRDGHTPAPSTGPAPQVGESVVAFEPEDSVRADAMVLSVNPAPALVVLDVDWDSMTDDHAAHCPTPAAQDTATGAR